MALYVDLPGGGSDRFVDARWSEPQAVDHWEMDIDFKELHEFEARGDGSLVILKRIFRSFRGRLNDGWGPREGPEEVREYAPTAWVSVRKDDSLERVLDHPPVQEEF